VHTICAHPRTYRSLLRWMVTLAAVAAVLFLAVVTLAVPASSIAPTPASPTPLIAPGRSTYAAMRQYAAANGLPLPSLPHLSRTTAATQAHLDVSYGITETWDLEEDVPQGQIGRSDGLGRRNLGVDDAGTVYALWEYDRGIDDPAPEKSAVRFGYRMPIGAWTIVSPTMRGLSCGVCHTSRSNGLVGSSLAVADDGAAHILWMQDVSLGYSDATTPTHMLRTPSGAWSTPTALSQPKPGQYRSQGDSSPPDIITDRNGNAYALWVEQRDNTDDDEWDDDNVFFAFRQANGSWGAPERVSRQAVQGQRYDREGSTVSIAVDASGKAYALWAPAYPIQYPSQTFLFSYRIAPGQWSTPEPVWDKLPTGQAYDPALAVDSFGNAYAVWIYKANDYGQVRFAYRRAGISSQWADSQPIADWPNFDQRLPAIVADDAGQANVAWLNGYDRGYNSWRWNVLFSVRPADWFWGPVERVNKEEGMAASDTPPSLALDNSGSVWALWARSTWQGTGLRLSRRGAGIHLGGRVYVPASYLPEGYDFPLIDVPVALVRDGTVITHTISKAPDGAYMLYDVPITTNVVLSVTLEHALNPTRTFEILFNWGAQSVATTDPFTITSRPAQVLRNLPFADVDGINAPNFNSTFLAPSGAMYYHTHQAWELTQKMYWTLDFTLPVSIIGFFPSDSSFWRGPGSNGSGAGTDPFIAIRLTTSDIDSGNRPDNREWHEFGHHVQADIDNNLIPRYTGNVNHDGYPNPSSTDSWAEAFAEFFSMMVAQQIAQDPQPQMYLSQGNELNMEENLRPRYPGVEDQRGDEELAIASLLWDLVDPVNADDLTVDNGNVYADCVQKDWDSIMYYLGYDYIGWPGRSPIAPSDYGFIFDVKHLYDVLKYQRVGNEKSHGLPMDDLDELFIAHGLYKDANNNGVYDAGEEIGRVADGTRPDRRDRPAFPGSFIAVSARDAAGAPVTVTEYLVDMRFPPPFAYLSYSFTTRPENPTRLYIQGPAPQYHAQITITPRVAGKMATAPLVFTNDFYWQETDTRPADYFLEHTFLMTNTMSVYLPVIVGNWMGRVNADASAAHQAVQVAATATPTPRACQPSPTPMPPIVESIVPASAVPGSSVQVTIYGYFFQPGASPYIGRTLLGNVEYLGAETTVPHRWRLRATVPASLAAGVYDVTVVNPDGKAGLLPRGFTVAESASPTPTRTPTVAATPPTATATRLSTTTATPTTVTQTPTTSATPAATATQTPTTSATATPTVTPTGSVTSSPSATMTATATGTLIPPPSLTATPTATATVTQTSTATQTATPPATPTASSTPLRTTTPVSGWQTIFADDFDGSFPGPWVRYGNPGWGRTKCRASTTPNSVWPAADGSGAVVPCTNSYPNNLNAQMIYGPFSLASATAAEVTFSRWQKSEQGYDYFMWLASIDGTSFSGWQNSGDSGGWITDTLDLSNVPNLGDLRGRPQVWIMFAFQSDGSVGDQGVFLDDVVVREK